MLLTCDRNELTDAMSVCIHATVSKGIMPALESVMLSITPGTMSICGYNAQMAIEKELDVESDMEERFLLPARMFFDIIRKAQGDTVTMKMDEKLNLTISCGRAVFDLKADSPELFPELPIVRDSKDVHISSALLRDMIGDTMFAISTNESKPVHTGTLFEVEGETLTLVSVDGYRLAVRKETMSAKSDESFSFIVPGSTLKELYHILPDSDDPVTIRPERASGLFEFDRTVVTTRLIQGEFLDYKKTIPTDMPVRLKVSRSEMINAVERVSLIISERLKNPVRCVFEGDILKLSCFTALGKSYDEMHIPFCQEKVEIGFNNRYLLDALRACSGDELVLELKSGLSPCLFKPVEGESYVYLVLPVRLKADDI